MSIYAEKNLIGDIFYKGYFIKKGYYCDNNLNTSVIFDKIKFPTSEQVPATYVESLVESTTGAEYKTYNINESCFYRVEVQGGGGKNSGESGQAGGPGGKLSKIVYLVKGTKCLLWSGTQGTNWDWSGHGNTGYPTPTDALGGTGATGHSEGGGGGGGAANHGRAASHADGSSGGAGSGFLAGTDQEIQFITHKEAAWTKELTSRDNWTTTDFSVKHLYVMALTGGGAGACGNNDDARAAGGGGGAFGDGGTSYSTVVSRTSGPGGTWGQGTGGGHYGSPGSGAWAILDFSRNQWEWGTGGGSQSTNGYCKLFKLIRS